ncbi:MAG TPA: carboxypeptidase-like regulatory domain-containing protein [Pyrinomonadaceae bacterium]|nr:carboxypeptidase-like regulatory domain-containing protein [Pyrinomonadaceae bacterium]
MRPFSRTIFILIMVTGTCGWLHAQSPARAVKKSSVTGKVTMKGKGISGLTVALRVSDFSVLSLDTSYVGVTDDEGVFRINEVTPGTYQLMSLAPAFVSVGEAARGKTLVIGEGETVEGADLTLVRGGVITGKVTDADGHPVIEQRVNLLPADRPTDPRIRTPALANAITDDRGIYRMYGLAAGRYKVSVGQSLSSFMMNYSGRPIYKETFYPDTTDQAKATIVEVTEGTESSNVDIAAGRASQTFTITGRVINGENSEPVGGVRFGLRVMTNGQPNVVMNTSAVSDTRGQFRAENLTPGKYALFIMPQLNNPASGDPVTFEIIDQDLNDLVVKTSKGASIGGIIVLENSEDKTAYSNLLKLRLQGYVQSADQIGNMGQSTPINGDGSFILTGLQPGSVSFSFGSFSDPRLLRNFHLKRTERDGVIQPRGVEVKNGDQITGIRLVVAYGTSTLRGTVTTVNGTVPSGARISLRLTMSGEVNSSFRPPEIDSRGHFVLEGLPAGQYELTAFVFLPGSRAEAPRTTRQVSISEGMITDVQLTIDLGQTPQ